MFNRVILVGNLTRDVDLRYLNTGIAVTTFGIASNRRYKKQDGTQVDDTCFIDVTMFGRTAEVANQYLRKGSKILVEGRLQFDTWTDQQGNKRSKHSILAESMVMLDSRNSQGDYSQDGYGSYATNNQSGNGYAGSNHAANSHGGGNQQSASYPNSSYQNSQNAESAVMSQHNNMGSENYGGFVDNHADNANSTARRNQPQMPEIDIDEEIPF